MTQTMPRVRHQISTILIVAVAYAIVVSLMTWPAPLHLSQRLIGNNIDNWIFYWNNWWLERAIREGHNWFFSPYIFYPQGASLVAHSSSHANSILAFVLKPLVGPVAAFNLTFLLGLWLSAVGMFLLAYDITRHRPAAFLAGFIFAFAPYHLTQALAHAHLGSIHWWPFYALFLGRALRGYRISDALFAGLFAALTLWSGLQLALLLALWTLVYMGWWFIATRPTPWRAIGMAGVAAFSALLLSLPILVPVIKNWGEIGHAQTPLIEQTTRQTDLLAYFIPPTYNTLVGPRLARLYERFIANQALMPYPGFAVLALTVVALLRQHKRALFWGLSAGLWTLLAAGPALRINGVLYPHIPLPYRLVGNIFPIVVIRAPDRFNLLVVFSLSVLAGIGAAWLYAHRRRWLLPLALLVIIEYLCAPLPMWDLPPASPFYEQMARQETKYGVVDYPMDYELAKLWLYYQTLHGHPLVQGHVSRYTAADYAFIHSQPLLDALYQVAQPPPYLSPADEADTPLETDTYVQALGPSLRSLSAAGVRYIIVHKPYLDAGSETHFWHVFPAVPVYEDVSLAAYETTRPFPVYYDGFPTSLTPDMALVRFDVQQDSRGTEWQFQVVATSLVSQPAPLACQIELIGENGSVLESPVTFFAALSGAEGWARDDLEMEEVTVLLPQVLTPGTYHWALACPGTERYTVPETLEVYPDGHFTYLRRSVDVAYGEDIQLVGYRWQTAGANLQVALLWKALEQPRADYKVFVHLLNADGEIVQQHDAMPCGWQCPTSQWRAKDTVLDQASVPLWGLPAGTYRLAVGLYTQDTQERLPVRARSGEIVPDSYFVLPDPFLISSG